MSLPGDHFGACVYHNVVNGGLQEDVCAANLILKLFLAATCLLIEILGQNPRHLTRLVYILSDRPFDLS